MVYNTLSLLNILEVDTQFEIIKLNDNIKNNWIISNNYNLLRILYKDDISLKILEFFENL